MSKHLFEFKLNDVQPCPSKLASQRNHRSNSCQYRENGHTLHQEEEERLKTLQHSPAKLSHKVELHKANKEYE